jgi:monomeric isocitrate dehydrogenase
MSNEPMESDKDFTLNGKTYLIDQKWGAKIWLTTPDGKTTMLDSGACFSDKQQADSALLAKLDEILCDFQSHGGRVVSKNIEQEH